MSRKRTLAGKDSPPAFIYPGPLGCKCQTLGHRLTGDGCDECNPELVAEFLRDSKEETK